MQQQPCYYRTGVRLPHSRWQQPNLVAAAATYCPTHLIRAAQHCSSNHRQLTPDDTRTYLPSLKRPLSIFVKSTPPPAILSTFLQLSVTTTKLLQLEHKLAYAKKVFDEMLMDKIIRPSDSPYASPLHLLSKPDREFRICIDSWKLYTSTVPDWYPVPHSHDFASGLEGACIF